MERPNWSELSLSLLEACGIDGRNVVSVYYDHQVGQPPTVEVEYRVIGFSTIPSVKRVRFVPADRQVD